MSGSHNFTYDYQSENWIREPYGGHEITGGDTNTALILHQPLGRADYPVAITSCTYVIWRTDTVTGYAVIGEGTDEGLARTLLYMPVIDDVVKYGSIPFAKPYILREDHGIRFQSNNADIQIFCSVGFIYPIYPE